MYEQLAKSAPTILDDPLFADSYLNVLHMPSAFPHSERSRRSPESANSSSTYMSDFEDEPCSNGRQCSVIMKDHVAAGLCCIPTFYELFVARGSYKTFGKFQDQYAE
ncbi:PREDICTED: uncharacterized protein LOC101295587 [Fragaria vesca subsp. vesca]|uniref:uncharacterized protein LOC101295587 n=1 Tax=Fragaria vesca subsp. vesca TaxID=101020 RepID=UPI0002C30C21|nr:PREDICTED: uncharacterized protein LOC101295587 [Fragaria vesca subsp. vesca]